MGYFEAESSLGKRYHTAIAAIRLLTRDLAVKNELTSLEARWFAGDVETQAATLMRAISNLHEVESRRIDEGYDTEPCGGSD